MARWWWIVVLLLSVSGAFIYYLVKEKESEKMKAVRGAREEKKLVSELPTT